MLVFFFKKLLDVDNSLGVSITPPFTLGATTVSRGLIYGSIKCINSPLTNEMVHIISPFREKLFQPIERLKTSKPF